MLGYALGFRGLLHLMGFVGSRGGGEGVVGSLWLGVAWPGGWDSGGVRVFPGKRFSGIGRVVKGFVGSASFRLGFRWVSGFLCM